VAALDRAAQGGSDLVEKIVAVNVRRVGVGIRIELFVFGDVDGPADDELNGVEANFDPPLVELLLERFEANFRVVACVLRRPESIDGGK
jgi:hypothetical protein